MKSILRFILEEIVKVNQHNYIQSLLSTVKVSVLFSPFVYVIEKMFDWGFENQDYIYWVLVAILIDWFFGTLKHMFFTKDKFGNATFHLGKNAIGLTLKIALTVGCGFLFEGLAHLTQKISIVEETLSIILRLVVFMYPSISAWENIYIVSGEKFPPKKWMEKIGLYKNTADINDLIDKK